MALLEQFDGYTNGDDLASKNGGSGWSAAWSISTGGAFLVTNAQSVSSPNSVKTTNTAAPFATRAFASQSAGTIYVSVRPESGINNHNFVGVDDTPGNTKVIVDFYSDNNIQYYNGTSYVSFGTWSANTWYRIGIQWDNAGHANQARYNIDNGAWTSWANANGTFSSISGFYIYSPSTSGGHIFIDDICDTYTVPTGSTTNPNFLLRFI